MDIEEIFFILMVFCAGLIGFAITVFAGTVAVVAGLQFAGVL